MTIHPSAVICSSAEIGSGVEIGPFVVVESGVRIGEGCRIAARASVKEGVTLGEGNQIGEGAVIGGTAQHLSPPEESGGVRVGDRNVIREHSTIHRAMHAGQHTVIGDDCLLMVGAHVAHDCLVGDHVVLTNNVLLAGHVSVGERAYIGGGAAVHQFCRVGRLAMVGGCSRVTQDIPPFVMIDGATGMVVGLNRVGLRRAGFDRNTMRELKQAYTLIYRSGMPFEERLTALVDAFGEGPAAEFAPFLSEGTRGFVRERRSPPGGAIRPIVDKDEAVETRSRWAG